MLSRQWLLFVSLLLLAAGLLSVGCGGSGDDRGPPDLSKIPTATPPDPLPEPLIVGETSPVPQGATYVVQAGDSPATIAERFGVAVEAIMEANGITDPTRLEVGQVLTIPGAAPDEGEVLGATAEPPSTPELSGEGTYTVQAGDIAVDIAERFGVTVEELAAANNTTVQDLRSLDVGDVLVIPSPAPTATPE